MHEKWFDFKSTEQGVSIGYESHGDWETEQVLAHRNREWQVRDLQLLNVG